MAKDNAKPLKSEEVVAADPPAQQPPPSTEDAPFEIKDGIWDWLFALITGAIAISLVITEIVIASSYPEFLLAGLKTTQVGKDVVLNGTFAERFVAMLSVIGMTIGVGTITIGAWLAALEARARLSKVMVARPAATPNAHRTFNAISIKELGDAVGVIVEKFGRVRGTTAVIVTGLVIVLFSLFAGASILLPDAGDATQPASTNTSTPDPTDEPSDDASNSDVQNGTAPGDEPVPSPSSSVGG